MTGVSRSNTWARPLLREMMISPPAGRRMRRLHLRNGNERHHREENSLTKIGPKISPHTNRVQAPKSGPGFPAYKKRRAFRWAVSRIAFTQRPAS